MKTSVFLALFNSYITAAITASDTSLVLKSVTSIPTAPFMALLNVGTDKEEVVKVTAVNTTTKELTIVRAQGGTSAVAHSDNTLFHHCEIGAVNINLDGLTVTLAGATGLNAMSLTVTDTTTQTSGESAGLRIVYTSTGIKTSTGQVAGISLSLTISADTPYAYGISIYRAAIANKTVGIVAGIDMYLEDAGTACGRCFAINIGMVYTNAATESGFMRMRNHGATPLDAIFKIEANNPATYLLRMGAGTPYHSSNVSVQDGRIAINYNGSAKFLKVYSS